MKGPALLFPLAAASCTDLRGRYVDNLLVLWTLLTGVIITASEKGIPGILDGLAALLLVFLCGFGFFAAGFLGAGDVKFLMALSMASGIQGLLQSLLPTAVCAVFIFLFLQRKETGPGAPQVPMTIHISIGFLLTL